MEKIKEWLRDNGSGSGYDDGSGYSYGYGSGSDDGSGSGYGDGSGYGSGYGSGSGYGDGSGYGLKSINNNKIYVIDGVQTIITNVKLNLAKGYIVKSDLTLDPCYVVKGDGYFAHGKTPKEANDALRAKIYENMDEDEAIEKFMGTFREDASYAGRDFFEWHHYLTGSCLMGRESFVKDKGLSLDATYTVREFIELCKHAYGGEVIGHLKEKWEEKYDKVQNS